VAIPNTGFTYKMEANTAPDPADETNHKFQLTATGDGAAGTFSFNPTATNMNPVGIDTLYYDIEQTDGAAKTRTIVRGVITINPNITDAGL